MFLVTTSMDSLSKLPLLSMKLSKCQFHKALTCINQRQWIIVIMFMTHTPFCEKYFNQGISGDKLIAVTDFIYYYFTTDHVMWHNKYLRQG